MSLKTFLHKLWDGIKHIFESIEKETKILVPIAIDVVQKIKVLEDVGAGDILTAIIPGNIDDKINAKLKDFLPKLLLELQMTQEIANITDPNQQLQAILSRLKLSSDNAKNAFYHGLASLILSKLSDGKLSWSDAVAVVEYYYQNVTKPATIPTA